MALTLVSEKKNLKVVLLADDAVGNKDDDNYMSYLKTLNEEMLDLKGEPTRFVLRSTLTWNAKEMLRKRNIRYNPSEGQMDMDITYMTDLVRFSLIGVENPESVPKEKQITFKRDSDGYASKELVNALDNIGQLTFLFFAIQGNMTEEDTDLVKKN